MNTIPDSCDMTINIRHTQDRSRDTLVHMIHNLADESGVSIDISLYGALLYTAPKHEKIIRYQEIARKHLGEQVMQSKEHGASDGRFFAEQ